MSSDVSRADAPPGEGPVVLALSTFRRSDHAVERALAEAAEGGPLVVVYVADRNLARYMVGTDLGWFRDLEETCEKELLAEHEEDGRRHVDEITRRAAEQGIETASHVRVGRFAKVVLEVIEGISPRLIVTTRSHRPHWVRRFFGSPVDDLIESAGCPVVEA